MNASIHIFLMCFTLKNILTDASRTEDLEESYYTSIIFLSSCLALLVAVPLRLKWNPEVGRVDCQDAEKNCGMLLPT